MFWCPRSRCQQSSIPKQGVPLCSHTPIPRQCLKGSKQFWLLNLHCFGFQGQGTIQKSGLGPTSGLQCNNDFEGLVPGFIRSTLPSSDTSLTVFERPLVFISLQIKWEVLWPGCPHQCRYQILHAHVDSCSYWHVPRSWTLDRESQVPTNQTSMIDASDFYFFFQPCPPLERIIGWELVWSICTMVEKMRHQNKL